MAKNPQRGSHVVNSCSPLWLQPRSVPRRMCHGTQPGTDTILNQAPSCLRRWIHVEQKNLHGQTQGNVWTLEARLPRTTLSHDRASWNLCIRARLGATLAKLISQNV